MKKIIINHIVQVDNSIEVSLAINGKKEKIVISFSNNALCWLVTDRIDFLVMGLILLAVKQGYDFESRIPISEGLYYNLTNHFINAIASCENLHHPKIEAPIIPNINSNGNIVATGVSCGVDSLYTIYTHTQMPLPNYKLNHLFFMNVGSHNSGNGEEDSSRLYHGRRELCRKFAQEAQLPLIEVESNMHKLLYKLDNGYSHIEYHTYMALSCLLLLQKGLKMYFYSSGKAYSNFNCNYKCNSDFDAANYDLLTLMCASFGSTKFISAGGNNNTRIEKVKTICKYDLASKYLNVCIKDIHNCGKCFKCTRTLLELDAVGETARFQRVFNIKEYHLHKQSYLEQLYMGCIFRDQFMIELKPFFKSELTILLKLRTVFHKAINVFCNRIL